MSQRAVLFCLFMTLAGCVSLGPADGHFYATGTTPSDASCLLDVAAVGSGQSGNVRAVSGNFREGFIIGPSQQGHRITLTCSGSIVATRAFKYGQDVRIGGELAVSGSAP